ncbi:hypothetical protein Droror1_Dr00017557, partial [Drosera rotundifolia]
MVFALERIPSLAQDWGCNALTVNQFPLLVGWSEKLNAPTRNNFKNHDKDKFASFLAGLSSNEIEWRPYQRFDDEDFLPPALQQQVALDKSRTVMVSFEKAIYYRPDLCPRQFGLGASALTAPLLIVNPISRGRSKGGVPGKDWSKHKNYVALIREWGSRHALLISPSPP